MGVLGVWSRSPETTATVRERFPSVGRIYASAEELLADPEVRFVDLATGPEGRLDWIEAAVEAGKHVLAQKPLTLSAEDLALLPALLERAAVAGVRIAVNHNGRWAPPWRAASLLLRDGAIGEVVGVTHLHDKPLPPLAGTPFDDVPHMLLTDYLLHWVDITRAWLTDGGAGEVTSVQAVDSRIPGQPQAARNPWSATVSMATGSGATATIRIPGPAVTSQPGCPFWVQGTTGTLRGSVLLDSDRLDLDDGSTRTPVELSGAWFVDGFAAAMGELMCAVGRGPRARELRGRRRAFGRPGPRGPGVRRAGRHARRGLHMSDVVDEVPVDVATGRVYAEGWQSWSPTTWYPLTARGLRPDEEWQHLMRFRPGTPVAEDGVQGEGLLVVDPGNGAAARLYGSTDPVSVPTLHAMLEGDHVVVRSTGPVDVRTHDDGAEEALAAYGDTWDSAPKIEPPSVWCSWYRYFEDVTAADIVENVEAFSRHELAVDVVQIDDGWSPGLGEGLTDAERFGSLPAVVDRIRDAGRRAGLWLAPFLVGAETTLAREHADWLVGPAGRNWGQDLVGLDLRHPGVRDLLTAHLQRLVGLGIDYLKLDFLYAGCASTEPRPTVRGSRWSVRLSAPTSTWSAAAHPCCPASDWSTPCGSPPTPSTREERTGPPVCAASCRWRPGPGSRAGSGSTTPTAWWPGRRTPSASGGPTRRDSWVA